MSNSRRFRPRGIKARDQGSRWGPYEELRYGPLSPTELPILCGSCGWDTGGGTNNKAFDEEVRRRYPEAYAALHADLVCPNCGPNVEWVISDEPRAPCPHGDPTCPCQDGDSCHYEGPDPMFCHLHNVRHDETPHPPQPPS